ncbi:DUF4333 domain-containing protein [Nocardia asteroides]|uniref:DUF4333 domain-containing protein n=1 Tax=Nocardia asteroides TaxID=1824 RepID=UPI001E5BB292|nr:DUF4333 domain-containing protein [Nocardia asteroides]UGT56150.1 DUF4333 domain-containing protein [Nocardia asteroides]
MSGPYGPNGPGEGSNDPTQHWGGQQGAGGAGPTQHWGGAAQPPQDPQQAQPTQHWGGQQPQQQWGQQPQQPAQQPQWGQQPPQQPTGPQQQWGQTQPPPQDWNAQAAGAQQWGQQPQQQWGQQPQQQWGQQPQQAPGAKKGKGLVIGLVVAGVLVLAAVIGLLLVVFSSDELDNTAVQDGVSRVLKDSYGIADVSDVSCPSGQKVEVDATFTCDLKVSGEAKKVSIKITKDDGTYEVGRPN